MPIIDMQKRLVEVGRVRMGKRSDKGVPQKLETFRLTSRDQSRLAEAARLYGGTVSAWEERPGEYEVVTDTAELPILLLPGQALSQWHELWGGGGCQRRCDGVTDVISDGPCVCDGESGDRKCKPTTRLSVMLPDIPGLGVWRLESHGYYAAVELAATAGMLEQATARGQLLPARLRIDQRRQVKDGKTTLFAVPVIDIDVRLPDMLAGGQGVSALPSGYTPVPALERGGVSVADGLEAVAREAAPRVPNGRSAAPLGPVPDIDFGEAGPVPVVDAGPVEATSASAAAPAQDGRYATQQQRKRLFAIAGERGVEAARMREILADVTGQQSTAQIPADLYDQVIAAIEAEEVAS